MLMAIRLIVTFLVCLLVCEHFLPVAGGQNSQGRCDVPQAVDQLVRLEQSHRSGVLGSRASKDVDGCEGQARPRRCAKSTR